MPPRFLFARITPGDHFEYKLNDQNLNIQDTLNRVFKRTKEEERLSREVPNHKRGAYIRKGRQQMSLDIYFIKILSARTTLHHQDTPPHMSTFQTLLVGLV